MDYIALFQGAGTTFIFFCQMFYGLRLFKRVRLFRTLEYFNLHVYLICNSNFNWDLLYACIGCRHLVGSTNQACLKINGMTLFSSKSFLLISAGPQKPQKLTASKIKYEKIGPKILIPC